MQCYMDRPLTSVEIFLTNLWIGASWSIKGPVTADILNKAIEDMGNAHPTIKSIIVPKDSALVWAHVPEGTSWYKLETITTDQNTNDPHSVSQASLDIIEKALHKIFTPGCHLMYFWLVHNPAIPEIYEFITVGSHAHSDARSTLVLMEDLILALSCRFADKDPGFKPQSEVYVSGEEERKSNDQPRNPTCALLPSSAKVPASERTWALYCHQLPKTDPLISSLVAASKKHGVTISSAISTCLLEAMDIERKKSGLGSDFYHIWAPVALGNYGHQVCASNTAAVVVEINKEGMPFWDIARLYHQKLATGIKEKHWYTGPPDLQMYDLKLLDTTMFDSQGRILSYMYSNVGNLNAVLGKEGVWLHPPFSVEKFTWTTNQNLFGACFVVVLASFNGNLNISVGYPSPTYPRSLIQSIVENALKIAAANS
eukprot:Phypoly_transcript_09181.p1 GENE.Phypoly_transcript_09181~~Phypoly_transcript_09181.p1  ORF type:complete len:427 (+),score=56.67 Phypoly_transcript_09181:68-1348(+)